jgi:hypothetical protein
MTVSAGQALRLKIELAGPLLRRSASAFWTTGDLRSRYLAYLQVMHMIIRASVPLMELAAQRCAALAPADPAAALIEPYLRRHIAEELHHDEWLAGDLRAAGIEPAPVLAQRPGAAVASLVGAQYYWISHYHPVCLLGYIGALEGTAPAPETARWLGRRTGYPRGAFRTLDHHARIDDGHAADLYHLVDCLDLDEPRASAIGCSALATMTGLGGLFLSLANAAYRGDQPDVHTRP